MRRDRIVTGGLRAVGFGSVALVALAGCSSIRVVKTTPEGGVLALLGGRDGAHDKAVAFMQEKCPSGYAIVEEGEAVIGENTEGNTSRGLFNSLNTTSSSTQKTEWRLTFKCKGGEGAGSGDSSGKPTGQLHTVIVRF